MYFNTSHFRGYLKSSQRQERTTKNDFKDSVKKPYILIACNVDAFLCHSHLLASGAKKSKKYKTVSVGHKLPFVIHIVFIFEYTSKSF